MRGNWQPRGYNTNHGTVYRQRDGGRIIREGGENNDKKNIVKKGLGDDTGLQ